MKKLMVTVMLCFCATIFGATAKVEKIESAFGMKLGDIFDPATATGNGQLTDGTPMYRFIPSKPFRSFKQYFVMITPKTHRIYCIWAQGEFENTGTAQKEQALLLAILKQKYGENEKPGLFDRLGDVQRIEHGDRYIMLKVSGFSDVTLDVRYYDAPLDKLAEKERLEIEAQKVDSSGL